MCDFTRRFIVDNKPIFSVDIHPKGDRFATGGQGGQGGRVVIWNLAPVLSEEDEENPKVPKMLCQMDSHLSTKLTSKTIKTYTFLCRLR